MNCVMVTIASSQVKLTKATGKSLMHIEAHFLTCCNALTIARLLQLKCKNHYSINQILSSLKKQNCSGIDESYWLFDYIDDASKDLFEMMDLKPCTKFMQLNELKKLFSGRK